MQWFGLGGTVKPMTEMTATHVMIPMEERGQIVRNGSRRGIQEIPNVSNTLVPLPSVRQSNATNG